MVRRRRDKEDLRHGDITFRQEDVEHDFEFDDYEAEDDREGYEEEEDADEGYSIGEDDPDYDLSETAGYRDWEPRSRSGSFFLPQWIIVAISLLLILTLLLPALRWFG